eukprot:4625361-Pleurochrysis_carterae.AAC.1
MVHAAGTWGRAQRARKRGREGGVDSRKKRARVRARKNRREQGMCASVRTGVRARGGSREGHTMKTVSQRHPGVRIKCKQLQRTA